MLSISNTTAYTIGNISGNFSDAVNTSIERLSSGKRVNSAQDDPGDVSVISKFRYAIESQRRMISNVQDSISMLQTVDSSLTGLGGLSSLVATLREKVVASTNGTLTDSDRNELQTEIQEYIDEISRVTGATEFNTRKLLDGSLSGIVSSNDGSITGYALGEVENNSYIFNDIVGASRHEYQTTVTSDGLIGNAADAADNPGAAATLSVVTGVSTSSESYEILFVSSTSFKVYNDSGVVTAQSTVGSTFTIDGLQLKLSAVSTYKAGYKLNFDTNSTSAIASYEEGNRAASASISLSDAAWDDDSMLHSYFTIKYDYDGGSLKYNAFDIEGNQMGNWTEEGDRFTSFSSSKLGGSSFVFSAASSAVGDTWKYEYGVFGSLNSGSASLDISSPEGTFSVTYDGDDKLSDIVSRINTLGDGIASASLEDRGTYSISAASTSLYDLSILAYDKGTIGKLSIADDDGGNFVTVTGLSEVSGTGRDASITYDGTTYSNHTGVFYDILDNIKLEVLDGKTADKSDLIVNDKSIEMLTDINGGSVMSINIRNLTPEALGLKDANGNYMIDVTTSEGRSEGLSLVDSVTDTITGVSAKAGAMINALDNHVSYLGSNRLTYEEVLSNHEDVDFVQETINLNRNLLGLDTSAAMMAQANLIPQRVLTLLGIA